MIDTETVTEAARRVGSLGAPPHLDPFRPMRTVAGTPVRFIGIIKSELPLVVAYVLATEEDTGNYTADGFFYRDRRSSPLNLVNVDA